MNLKIEKIICDDSQNITKWHDEKNINLSIIKPPYISEENLNDAYLKKFQSVMGQVAMVTKPGGICCLILDEDKSSDQTMSIVPNRLMSQLFDSKKESIDWKKHEEIIWVKSLKSSVKELNHSEKWVFVNFEETPFSTIHILQRNGSEFEYVDSEERISKLDLDKKIEEEWTDSIWFVQPTKSEFQERTPFEILTRLVQIFSDKNEIILDPFSGFGGTAIVSKKLLRNFLCFDIDKNKINQALKQIKDEKIK